jgi:hypothetical protein
MMFLALSVNARVVINEIFYNAPDDLEDLEYVEIYNSGDKAIDLTGWAFTKGIKFKFRTGTQIDAKGFLVLCRNEERFKQFYNAPIAGVFTQKLSNKGERLELCEPAGRTVDSVKYQDTAPWPMGADGQSGSLERICPESAGEDVANWASSPLSSDRIKPAGTPGKANANFSATLPPVISNVSFTPKDPAPNQSVSVEADVRDESDGDLEVTLLYRTAGPGFEKSETAIPMTKLNGNRYSGKLSAESASQLIRFRIRATAKGEARRFFPAETEPRPAMSVYVQSAIQPAKIPFAWIINTAATENRPARQRARFRERHGNPPRVKRYHIILLLFITTRSNGKHSFSISSGLWGDHRA